MKNTKKLTGIVIAGLTLAAGFAASVSSAAPKPEDSVEYRQGVLFAMGWNVGEMGAMVKGDVPFDAQRFAFLAERTAKLSPMVLEGFRPDSKGAKSHARSRLWDNMDDFEQRMKTLNEATQALATAAQGGDEGAMKRQFGETVQVCKKCHDEYREKQ